MTVTLLKMPKLNINYDVPVINPVDRVRWFKLSPAAKCVETSLKEQYNIKYLQSTALTSKLQLEQLLEEMDELQQ
jgi:hypothetical protein